MFRPGATLRLRPASWEPACGRSADSGGAARLAPAEREQAPDQSRRRAGRGQEQRASGRPGTRPRAPRGRGAGRAPASASRTDTSRRAARARRRRRRVPRRWRRARTGRANRRLRGAHQPHDPDLVAVEVEGEAHGRRHRQDRRERQDRAEEEARVADERERVAEPPRELLLGLGDSTPGHSRAAAAISAAAFGGASGRRTISIVGGNGASFRSESAAPRSGYARRNRARAASLLTIRTMRMRASVFSRSAMACGSADDSRVIADGRRVGFGHRQPSRGCARRARAVPARRAPARSA